jgi:hypothetical protein
VQRNIVVDLARALRLRGDIPYRVKRHEDLFSVDVARVYRTGSCAPRCRPESELADSFISSLEF